jgi:CheY-like chemotaxis protein
VPCKGCILVVDDDPDIREALIACLESHGCTALAATDGRDALELLKHCPAPCFILLDMNMPSLDGHELVRLVREGPCHCAIPMVSMTAGGDRILPPVHHHLEKPFGFEEVTSIVERLCQDPDWLHGAR